jgi:predicted nuclease of restriction endonuclease-like (RecB) superfamily
VTAPALPDGYADLLEQLKRTVATARWQAQRVVNTELLRLYWRLGSTVLERQREEGWGTRVIDRLATDLRAAFPDMRGLSRSNLKYMRQMAAAWSEEAIGQQPVGQLPWGHVTVLLDKLDDQAQRDWYAAAAVEHGWSRSVLQQQLMNQLHRRVGAAPSNFPAQLPAGDSELAQQLTRDPYVLDFLDLAGPVRERDLEDALVSRVQALLLELGHGFAFAGRQYHFEVDGDDFYIDLLFFNWAQNRFVVIELKIGSFEPAHLGQLGFYVSWADQNLRQPDHHSPTIGILLCAGRNDNVVRYALASATAPLAVADYTYDTLPPAVREAVPSTEQLGTAATAALTLTGEGTLTAGPTATPVFALAGEGTLTDGDKPEPPDDADN